MIPADQLELITAAVDGELSAAEAHAFRRLLRQSADARALFAALKAQSERLSALPQVVPPVHLRARVLARIATATPAPRAEPKLLPNRTPEPVPSAPVKRAAQPATLRPNHGGGFRARLARWAPVAVAACVLLGVTLGSFSYFHGQSANSNGVTARAPWAKTLPGSHGAPSAVPLPADDAPQTGARRDPNAVARNPVVPTPQESLPAPPLVAPEDALVVAPPPRPRQADLLGSRILPPLPPFDLIRVRLPFLRAISELERADIRQELHDELSREPGAPARLDLFVRETVRGVEVFQLAAKAAGLSVFADASTLDRLKKRQVASVVIFTESLTATELADLFAKLTAEDAKYSPRVCDSLHAAPVVRSDETDLKAVLGVDIGLFKRAIGSGGTGQGGTHSVRPETKPLSAGTVDSVVKSVTSPGAKQTDKTAVLLTWQSANAGRANPATSTELQQFLARRHDRKPNTVPAMIVIRPAG